MNIVREILEKLGVEQINNKIGLLRDYRDAILQWNKKVNITTITCPLDFELKHYADSFMIADDSVFKTAKKIIDVGTGGGFPGVPLAIACPDKEFLLLDSLQKRLLIVEEICKNLGISNVTVCHGRAETLGQNIVYRENFDVAVSRAVARLSVLSEYCLPFVKLRGRFVSYKGANLEQELADAKKAISIMGGNMVKYGKPEIVNNVEGYDLEHQLVYIEKVKRTPSKYPRQAGTPGKSPII